MILIDNRDGSRQLAYTMALQDRCQLGTLEYGDVMLTGHGPNDATISVGVEVKSVSDLLQSIFTKRLQGRQIPGMLQSYDYSWLLVYGLVRPGEDNYLEVFNHGRWYRPKLSHKQRVPWSYLEGFLLTMQMLSPMRVKWVYNEEEAGKWLSVYDRWLAKKWDQHKGLQGFNESGVQAAPIGADPVEAQMAKIAAALPGVGWIRAWNAAKHFASVEEMMAAKATEWEKIDKFGPVLSKAVRSAIRRQK